MYSAMVYCRGGTSRQSGSSRTFFLTIFPAPLFITALWYLFRAVGAVFVVFVSWGPCPVVLRRYSCLCAQRAILGSEEQHMWCCEVEPILEDAKFNSVVKNVGFFLLLLLRHQEWLAILQSYSWLSAQGLFLEELREPYGVLGVETEPVTCNMNLSCHTIFPTLRNKEPSCLWSSWLDWFPSEKEALSEALRVYWRDKTWAGL